MPPHARRASPTTNPPKRHSDRQVIPSEKQAALNASKKRKAKVNDPQSMPATGPKRKTNSKTIYPSVSDNSSTSDEDSAQPLKKKRHTAPGPKHNVSKSVLNLKADRLQIVDNDIEDAGDGDGEQGEEDADVSGGEEDVTVDVMDDDDTLLGEYELKNITES